MWCIGAAIHHKSADARAGALRADRHEHAPLVQGKVTGGRMARSPSGPPGVAGVAVGGGGGGFWGYLAVS